MGLRRVGLLGLFLAVAVQSTYGVSKSVRTKLMNRALPLIKECGEEMEISNEKLDEIEKESQPIDPCFLACYFKKAEVMDEEGTYSLENAKKIFDEITEGENEDDAKKLDEIATKCASVNDEELEDGAKGCDRALLLHKCFHSQLS